MTNQAQAVAQILLDIEAVSLRPAQPFQWTSGLYAPIYTDNRLVISHPEARNQIEGYFVETIRDQFPQAEVIAGTATAGIPHAAIIADRMELPMIYVRSSAKKHGKQSAIEGQFQPGAKVVLIEDLISTGKSVLQAAETVRQAGGEVVGVVAIFSYLLPNTVTKFEEADCPLVTLSNYDVLVDVATQNAELAQYRDLLTKWHHDPVAWSKQFED